MKNWRIIIILAGIGLLFLCFIHSERSTENLVDEIFGQPFNFIGNIPHLAVILQHPIRGQKAEVLGHEVSVPVKWPLSLSVLLILFGAGGLLIKKDNPSQPA